MKNIKSIFTTLLVCVSGTMLSINFMHTDKHNHDISSLTKLNIEALTSNESMLKVAEKVKHTWTEERPNPLDPENPIIEKYYEVDCIGSGIIVCTPEFGIL